jgi:hypothetical protein
MSGDDAVGMARGDDDSAFKLVVVEEEKELPAELELGVLEVLEVEALDEGREEVM